MAASRVRIILLVLVVPLFSASIYVRAEQEPAVTPLGPRVPAKAGEICIVCNKPVTAEDDAYLVNGQRLAVHRKACTVKLESNPQKYTARLRPTGNFLGVEPDAAPALTARWLIFGLYVLLGLVFSALCVNVALNAGMRPAPWLFAGLFFNVVALASLLAVRQRRASAVPHGLAKIPETATPAPCPQCAHLNHPAARACLGCGAELRPTAVSEAARAGFGAASR